MIALRIIGIGLALILAGSAGIVLGERLDYLIWLIFADDDEVYLLTCLLVLVIGILAFGLGVTCLFAIGLN